MSNEELSNKVDRFASAMKELIGIMEEIGVFNRRARDNLLIIIDEEIFEFSKHESGEITCQ